MDKDKDLYLDSATAEFLHQFRRGLSSVRDVSGQFDHRNKIRKATGGFSTVYATHWLPVGAQPTQVCYKELNPPASNSPDQIGLTRKTIKRLTREVKIWKDLNHPNIIEFIGYAIEGERCDMRAILVSKWCVNGDIVEYLRKHPESNRYQLIHDIASGLHYLHGQPSVIVHGDLKPRNVLISGEGRAQLCDFGLSCILSELSVSQQTVTVPGFTIRYSACESIFDGVKTAKSDVYAFGCTCIYILYSERPFPGLINEHQVTVAIDKRHPPWSWDQEVPLERILSACCQPEQASRPSIGSVLQQFDLIFTLTPDSPVQVPISEAQAAENAALIFCGFLDNPVPGTSSKREPVRHFPSRVARLRGARINERARLERASLPRAHSPRPPITPRGVHHRDGSPPSSKVGVTTSVAAETAGFDYPGPTDPYNDFVNMIPTTYDTHSSVISNDYFSDMMQQFMLLVDAGLEPQLAATLIKQSFESPLEPIKTIYQLNPRGRSAPQVTMWLDIFSAITLRRPPRFSHLYDRLLRYHPNQSDFFLSTNGCCDEVMFCLSAIVNLEYQKYREEHSALPKTLHDRDLANGMLTWHSHKLRERLLAIDCMGQSVSPIVDLSTESPSTSTSPSSSSMSAYPFTHNNPNVPDTYPTSEIFRQSALLYLSTVTSGYSPSVEHTQEAIAELKEALEAVPLGVIHRVDRSLIFPICLAGCMTDDPGLRAFFNGKLSSLGNTEGNTTTSLQLMEAVWNVRDSTGVDVAWRDVMNDMKFELLMV